MAGAVNVGVAASVAACVNEITDGTGVVEDELVAVGGADVHPTSHQKPIRKTTLCRASNNF